ncbi:hypothetical protein H0H93_014093, partial [Arthromyces matolae]
ESKQQHIALSTSPPADTPHVFFAAPHPPRQPLDVFLYPSLSPPRQHNSYRLDIGAYGIPKHSSRQFTSPEHHLSVQVGEDAYFIRNNALGVADGVGGWSSSSQKHLHPTPSALFARRLMHYTSAELETELESHLNDLQDGFDVLTALERAYDNTINAHKTPTGAPLHSGSSTALVAVLSSSSPQPTVSLAHVGDCMGMVVRDSEIVWRSDEMWWAWNTPVQLSPPPPPQPPIPFNPPNPNPTLNPRTIAQLITVPVLPDDILILASDGLSDNLWDEDVLDEVSRFRRTWDSSFSSTSSSPSPTSTNLRRSAMAGMLSEALCSRARRVSERRGRLPDPSSPSSSLLEDENETPFGRRAKQEGKDFKGGKRDDSTLGLGQHSDPQSSSPLLTSRRKKMQKFFSVLVEIPTLSEIQATHQDNDQFDPTLNCNTKLKVRLAASMVMYVLPPSSPNDTISTYPYLTCSLSHLQSIHSSLYELIRNLARPTTPFNSSSSVDDDIDLNPTFDGDGLRVNIDQITLLQLDGIKQMLESRFLFPSDDSHIERATSSERDDSILNPRYITCPRRPVMHLKETWKQHMQVFNRLPDPASKNPLCDSNNPTNFFNFTSLSPSPFLTPQIFHSLLRIHLNIYTSNTSPRTISTSRSWCEHFLFRIASTIPQDQQISIHSESPPFVENAYTLPLEVVKFSPSVIPIPVLSWERRELKSIREVLLVKLWDYTISITDPQFAPGPSSQSDDNYGLLSDLKMYPRQIKSLFKLFVVPDESDEMHGLNIKDLIIRLVLELHRCLLALNEKNNEENQGPKFNHIRGALTNGPQWIFVILSESPPTSTTSSTPSPSPTSYTYKYSSRLDSFAHELGYYPFLRNTPFEEKVDTIAATLRSWIVNSFEDLRDDDLFHWDPASQQPEYVGMSS